MIFSFFFYCLSLLLQYVNILTTINLRNVKWAKSPDFRHETFQWWAGSVIGEPLCTQEQTVQTSKMDLSTLCSAYLYLMILYFISRAKKTPLPKAVSRNEPFCNRFQPPWWYSNWITPTYDTKFENDIICFHLFLLLQIVSSFSFWSLYTKQLWRQWRRVVLCSVHRQTKSDFLRCIRTKLEYLL